MTDNTLPPWADAISNSKPPVSMKLADGVNIYFHLSVRVKNCREFEEGTPLYRDIIAPAMNRQFPEAPWYVAPHRSMFGFVIDHAAPPTYYLSCEISGGNVIGENGEPELEAFSYSVRITSGEFAVVEDAIADLRGRMHERGISRATAMIAGLGLSEEQQEKVLTTFLDHALGVTG